ncbi:hypothetical protein [Klenkia taihuensis]|uniref:Uncharacterized protein n=1 Tax=Klenkia taihuensis TaxID=1225127 RepID=A0A1I1MZ79_9ACTN|nr:hypothetical protein [Klenkia taihuensis]SFC86860.1 hypothetical protein SAMN05661030_1756 [Klenkia taihuensis]
MRPPFTPHPHHRGGPFADAFAGGGRGFPGRGGGRRGPGGAGRGRGADAPPPVDRAEVAGWFAGRLPDAWTAVAPDLTVDRDEITVVVTVPAPDGAEDAAAAAAGRIARFREDTRAQRVAIAAAAQERFGRTVSWGATCGETTELFTTVSAPVMTRLRQSERLVLDTLVDAGVARSRSDALAWSVRLVGQHADEWLTQLRAAMASVEEVRAQGPQLH